MTEQSMPQYAIPKIKLGKTKADCAFASRVQEALKVRDYAEVTEAFKMYGAYLELIDL